MILDELTDLPDEGGPGGLEPLIELAKACAGDHLSGPEAELARNTLRRIALKAPYLQHLNRGALVVLLIRVATEENLLARRAYLSAGFTFGGSGSTSEMVDEVQQRERAWLSVLESLKSLGPSLWGVIPLLLAA